MSTLGRTEVDRLIDEIDADKEARLQAEEERRAQRPTPLRPPLPGRPPEDDALAALFKMHARLNRLEMAIEEHRIEAELWASLIGAAVERLEGRLRVLEGKA